jgi:hypothetical protein
LPAIRSVAPTVVVIDRYDSTPHPAPPPIHSEASMFAGSRRHSLRAQLAFAVIVLVTAVFGGAVPAHATWTDQYIENFDAPTGWWFDDGTSSSCCGMVDDPGLTFARMWTGSPPEWAAVRRYVHVSRANSLCSISAKIWVESINTPPTTVNFEAINPSSWTYLGLSQYKLPGNNQWVTVGWNTTSFRAPSTDFVIGVGMSGQSISQRIQVDDFTLTCSVA